MKIIPNRDKKLATRAEAIRQKYARKIEATVERYTGTEQKTWFIQVQEAEAYLADNTAPTPFLTALVAERGVALADMATQIKSKETAYRQEIGALLGKQQKELDELYA